MNVTLLLAWLLLTTPAALGQDLRAAPDTVRDSLAQTRVLYGAADFEGALASLPASPEPADENAVDRYRTLCLLALGRRAEAELAIERALSRDLDFRMVEGEVAPRVIEFFNEVRGRVLPMRAELLSARARADFDERNYAEAAALFTTVIELLDHTDGTSPGSAERRRIAEAFRQLSRERESEGGAAPGGARTGLDDFGASTRLTASVKPPVPLSRELPPWTFPRDQEWRTFRGVIEVTVNRTGRVEYARMLESIASFYDGPLVEAAKKWRFEPALLEGRPVPFRQRFEIFVRPEGSELRVLALGIRADALPVSS